MYNKEDKEVVLECYRIHKNIAVVIKLLKEEYPERFGSLCRNVVKKFCREAGYNTSAWGMVRNCSRRPKSPKIDNAKLERILNSYEVTGSLKETAQLLSLNYRSVCHLLQQIRKYYRETLDFEQTASIMGYEPSTIKYAIETTLNLARDKGGLEVKL